MYLKIKRMVDFLTALVAAALLSPIIAIAAVIVYFTMGSPIIFKQSRPGRNQQPFNILKLRTMKNTVDADGRLLSDSERITNTGRVLRRTSIDELPQLLNILRGEMSFIGPRPLLFRYLPYFRDHERTRFDVRPGIAGLAQARGRNTLNWDERLASDVEYVANLGPLLDLKILLATVRIVMKGSGVVDVPNSGAMKSLDEERENEQN